jgi:fructose/tagatose bisphosphate aldolase
MSSYHNTPNFYLLTEKGWLSYINKESQPIFQESQDIIFFRRTEITANLTKGILEDMGFINVTIHNEHYQDERRAASVARQTQSTVRNDGED